MIQSLKTYIMCGGSGTRLWPLSRTDNPKQMLSLLGDKTMLETTVERAASMKPGAAITVNIIGSAAHRQPLNSLSSMVDEILIEPSGRNTAAAVALASLHAGGSEDPYVLILPSDHAIETVEAFSASISRGMEAADNGSIVVFGITPDRAATGYGYIEAACGDEVSIVTRFVEKPDVETAQSYFSSGRHLWNAGIFLARASTLVSELEAHAPDILEATRLAYTSASRDGRFMEFDAQSWRAIRAQSIDYAVMEKSQKVSVVRAKFTWSDIGSFQALADNVEQDGGGNALRGDVIALESSNSLIRSEGPLVATLGVKDLAIIATADVTYVSPLARSEEVRKIVAALDKRQRPELHRTPSKAECGAVPGSMQEPFRNWLFDTALPFWRDNGLDHQSGGFHEVLDFSGNSTGADKRLRTMARQIYVFAKAQEMGWDGDASTPVRHGIAFLAHVEAAPRGGWFKTFDAGSEPLDRTEDVYDHAFVLLALAQALKAGHDEASPLAQRVLAFLQSMEVHTPGDDWNGYLEDCTGTLPRRANPHMHLLEAFLAWHEASGDEAALTKASQIVELLKNCFFDSEALWLREEFDESLTVTPSSSYHMEPGHQFEWAWLLHRYAVASGNPILPQARGLIASAKAFGINPVSGLAYDRIEQDGLPAHKTSRCWPQTEYLKAELMLARHGLPHAVFAAERAAESLWNHFIAPAPEGMWNDVCDVAGKPVAKNVPASTFYHIICAIDVYLDFGNVSD